MLQRIRLSGNRTIRLSVLLSLYLSFVICHLSFAADIPKFYGEELIVTATKLPKPARQLPWNVTRLTEKELAGKTTLSEALQTTTGIDLQSYGYYGALNSIRLRGTGASQVLVLLNGQRLNSPLLGMYDCGDIYLDDVQAVEVVRAPLSAVYGSDAISGAINVITKTPEQTSGYVSSATGSFNTIENKFNISNPNFYLGGGTLNSTGFRRNGDLAAQNWFTQWQWATPLGNLIAQYKYYDANKGVPGVPTSEADPASATEPNDRQKDRNTRFGLSLASENYRLAAFQNVLDQRLDPYIWGASTNQTWQNGLEWQQTVNQGFGQALFGLDYREDKGKGTMSGEHAINNYGAFVQEEIGNLTLGLRGDKHSTAGISLNPRLGLVRQLNQGLTLKLSAGTAFRAPTLNELYWNDGYMFGDASLRPEKSLSYEIGLERQLGENTIAKVSYYVTNTTDLILWDWRSSTIEARAKNVGAAYIEGVEFEWVKQLGRQGKAFINYAYQNAIDKEDIDPLAVGKRLRFTPQTKYNAGLVYNESSLTLRHVGESYADQYNTVVMPAFTVVDLHYAKKLAKVEIELAIRNLFDTVYSEAIGNDPVTWAARKYPMPGRNYSVGLKILL